LLVTLAVLCVGILALTIILRPVQMQPDHPLPGTPASSHAVRHWPQAHSHHKQAQKRRLKKKEEALPWRSGGNIDPSRHARLDELARPLLRQQPAASSKKPRGRRHGAAASKAVGRNATASQLPSIADISGIPRLFGNP
jgi:hypothetical protein